MVANKMNKKSFVFFDNDVIEINPEITFVLFNELIEKNIRFCFMTSHIEARYKFNIYSDDIEQVKEILNKIRKEE